MAGTSVEHLRSIENEKLRLRADPYRLSEGARQTRSSHPEAPPERATDTIIVKLRSSPAAVRRITMAARGGSLETASQESPWLAKLIQKIWPSE